ncbi:MAG: 4-carboxy-2-hydroxymuconate-6-semialdehyde dehydrogenase, partial [Candidatus Anoxychlamydiales bacterium]|nr:4-carboxy-2-hydroxymuconate-6-semialdehyde dehydrogenase [Candidatus Anoxychlamydiales bacterium]
MIKIAQIGCGYWGPNILRSLRMLNTCELKALVEIDVKRREFVKSRYPNVDVTDKIDKVLNDDEIQGVVIATPAESHYHLTKLCLEANKHVLVEKPLATNLLDAIELTNISYEKKLTLMVGHVFLYNPAVILLKKIIQEQIDNLYYFYSQRLNFGRIRQDVNVWWNLAPHDLSILLYLMNDEEPISIKVEGFSFTQSHLEDIAFATLKWKNNITANIHLSWLDPKKVRQLTVVGSKKMIVYNDLSEDKIAVHDKSIDCNNHFDDPGKVLFNHRVG